MRPSDRPDAAARKRRLCVAEARRLPFVTSTRLRLVALAEAAPICPPVVALWPAAAAAAADAGADVVSESQKGLVLRESNADDCGARAAVSENSHRHRCRTEARS